MPDEATQEYKGTATGSRPKDGVPERTTQERRVRDDFRRAREKKKEWIEKATRDYEFVVGQQWDSKDVLTLEESGVKALTINKIQPNLFLVSGIERQNRTDFKAFPEGEEDSITADIATLLLKNAMKRTLGEYKLSEVFEDGVICGEGWIEPFVDYTYDLVNGDLKLKKLSPFTVFPDPDGTEYDLSDGQYLIKFTAGLSRDALLRIFPGKEAEIDAVEETRMSFDTAEDVNNSGVEQQTRGYNDNASESMGEDVKEKEYDLTEYYYRKYVDKFLVADKKLGTLREAVDKAEADAYVATANAGRPAGEQEAVVVKRVIPEIWICCLVGMKEIATYKCTFFPRWKTFPLIPFFAHRITTPIEKKEAMIQGMVRSLIDPQIELNKRRTQELRLLNSSANSGWLTEKGAFVKKAEVKKFGAAPGAILEYNKGKEKPERIKPTPLSAGHHELAAQAGQDLKEISGINADLLALQEGGQSSGKAIHLRQQQGIVMLQRILDNYGQTKQILARFILSQLGDLYSVDTATRVCGQAFITENFSVPVNEVAQKVQARMASAQATGQPTPPPTPNEKKALQITQQDAAARATALAPGAPPQQAQAPQAPQPVVDPTGQLVMVVDDEAVGMVFNKVLTDTEVGKYDVAVGEAANSQTVKYANYLMLQEMASAGIPIPPDVLIEESGLQVSSKKRIIKAIEAAQQAAASQPAKAPQKK